MNKITNTEKVDANGSAEADDQVTQSSVVSADFAALISTLTGYFSSRVSAQALRSGIPLKDGVVGEDQITELAHRAGLRCQLHERDLARLSYLELPALVILKKTEKSPQSAAIIKSIKDGVAILMTESGGEVSAELAQLNADYSGRCYTLQPNVEREITQNAGTTKGHWLWSLAFSQKSTYLEASTGSIAVNFLGLALPLFIMAVYDRIIPNFAVESLMVLLSGMIIVAILDFLLRQLRALALDAAGKNIDTYLGNRVFNHLMYRRFGESVSSGATANTVRELDVLRDFLNSATLALVSDVPFLILFIVVINWIGGPLVWVPLVVIPLLIIFFLLTQVPLYRLTKRAYLNASNRNSVLFEILNGMESIKAMGAESWAAHRWEKAHAAGVKTSFASRFYGQVNQNVMALAQTISMLAIITLGVFLVRDGELSFGALFAVVILNGRVMAPIAQISQLIGRIHGVMIAYTEINKLMTSPKERDALSAGSDMPALNGNLVFDKVSFSYEIPGAQDGASVKVLDAISSSIKAGEKVGIVGTIGSGKSTLLKLILNLISVDEGTIRIEGIDSREIDPADLRSQIGYMPQNPHFFSGTLKENITLHKPWSRDSELAKAVQLAGIDNWLSTCPLGLSQPIGERGDYLSGGQRQSVALSRALLGDPKLILLDEPTSLLDSQAEARFVQSMASILQDKTLIVTTHRPAMLALVDRIIVLDQGHIALDGEKNSVLNKLAGKS